MRIRGFTEPRAEKLEKLRLQDSRIGPRNAGGTSAQFFQLRSERAAGEPNLREPSIP